MNILWLSWKDITHPDAGGAEISGEQHAIAWTKAGHTVHWVSINYPESKQFTTKDEVEYEHLGQKWMWFLGLIHLLYCYKWLTKWQYEYDLVVDEIHGPPLLTPLYVKKPKLVIIHEVAGDIWKKTVPFPVSTIMQYVIEPLFFKAYHSVPIIAGAQTTIDDLKQIGVPEKNITYIPYGVTIPQLNTNYPKENTPTLIFLSQLRPMKGFERVYHSFKVIKKQIPELKLWVVGDDTLPYGQEMKQKTLTDDRTASVTFFGKVPQEVKFELLKRAHLLVHGSYKEGWGLVVIEANAVGTPAVVFDAAGLRDSVRHNETGFIANNQKEFVDQVILLLNSTYQYSRYQNAAINWSKQFRWENATKASLALLSTLLKNPSRNYDR
ncbi:MAG: glycosyltransferase family 4 protein [bacterium]|nr:glycosyltransferase family 4 protein [bacterium]